MACNQYQFFYGTGGILSASYLNCGDRTPFLLTATGGVSGNAYGNIIIATTGSVTTYTGFASAGAVVGGYTYSYVPYTLFTSSSNTSAYAALRINPNQ